MKHDPILRAFADTRARGARRARPELVVSPGRSWTADDLDRAAGELARRLAEEGFGEGDAVGLAAAPGPAFLAGFLALRRRGAVPVLCDSARPTPDRLAALDRVGVTGFLACAVGWPDGAADWDLARRRPGSRPATDPGWGAVKLTSGSTGEPRGIATSAAALVADEAQLAATMGIGADDRLLAAVPFSHSYGFSSLAMAALVRGVTLVVPTDDSRSAPFAPLSAARDLGATVFPTVPAWLSGFVRLASAPAWPDSLRRVLAAGAPLAPETARDFRLRTGRAVHVFYGASECGGITYDRQGDAAERGTVGTPVAGVALELDAESGRLAVRSAAVSDRYLPEAAPELAGGRFLTSDLATLEAGGAGAAGAARAGDEVRLLGRADDLVIVRGRNVNPREVEAVLRQLPGVDEACVVGAAGPDGPRTVLRAVVAAPSGGVDYDRVVAFCRERLAEAKVPRSVRVVSSLPRTERGKLDREALALLAAAES